MTSVGSMTTVSLLMLLHGLFVDSFIGVIEVVFAVTVRTSTVSGIHFMDAAIKMRALRPQSVLLFVVKIMVWLPLPPPLFTFPVAAMVLCVEFSEVSSTLEVREDQ